MLNRKAPPKQEIVFFWTLSLFLNYFEQYQVHLLQQGEKIEKKNNQHMFYVVVKSIICQG